MRPPKSVRTGLFAGGRWIRNLALTIKRKQLRDFAIFWLDDLDKIVDKTPVSTGVVDGKTTTQFSPATQKWGYRARVLVPVELQGKIGKKVLYTSVWQASETEAANLAWPQVQKFEALLERARSGKFYPAREMEAEGPLRPLVPTFAVRGTRTDPSETTFTALIAEWARKEANR